MPQPANGQPRPRARTRPDPRRMLGAAAADAAARRPPSPPPTNELTAAEVAASFGPLFDGDFGEPGATADADADAGAAVDAAAEPETSADAEAPVAQPEPAAADGADAGAGPGAQPETVEDLAADAGDDDDDSDDDAAEQFTDSASPAIPFEDSAAAEEQLAGGIRIEAEPIGGASAAAVTVYVRDQPIMADRLDIASEKSRLELVAKIVAKTGAPAELLERALLEKAIACRQRRGKQTEAEAPPEPTREELLAEMDPAAVAAARAMLRDPQLIARITADVQALGVAGEQPLIESLVLVGTSRLLADPLGNVTKAASASGKSFVQDRVVETFPPEAIIRATTMTRRALAHMPPNSLRNKWVVSGERSRLEGPEAEESTRLLRELFSSKRLDNLITLSKPTGGHETVRVTQEGPIAYSETTSLQWIFHEDANRYLLLSTNESEEQTRTVIERIAADRSGATPAVDRDAILQRQWAAHRLLEPLPVVIPFTGQLSEHFPRNRVEARRGFPQLLSMIQAVALLHQQQRQRDSAGRIIATREDYALARALALLPLSHLLSDRVSAAAIRFHGRLASWAGSQIHSTSSIAKRDGKTQRAVGSWLNELAEVGAVEQVSVRRGNIAATWQLLERDTSRVRGMAIRLPKAEDLR